MNATVTYYNLHAGEYAEDTVNADLRSVQDRFVSLLPEKARVLDFGCGSGRDTKYFLEKGLEVDAADGSSELCKIAGEYTGITVKEMLFSELDENEKYDGIWACASILHVPKTELGNIFRRMARALKIDGIIYTSFKYGGFEGEKNGRYFSNFTESSIRKLLGHIPELCIIDEWISGDVRPGREEEKWLNLIIRKSNIV